MKGLNFVYLGDGRNNTPRIEGIAIWMGSNVDEVVCSVSRRVPRVYIQKGEVVEIRDYLEN